MRGLKPQRHEAPGLRVRQISQKCVAPKQILEFCFGCIHTYSQPYRVAPGTCTLRSWSSVRLWAEPVAGAALARCIPIRMTWLQWPVAATALCLKLHVQIDQPGAEGRPLRASGRNIHRENVLLPGASVDFAIQPQHPQRSHREQR